MKEALGIDDDNFNFDFENDIEDAPIGNYLFKMVDEAGNFNDVVVEDDSGSGQDIAEKVSEGGIPRTLTKEELREERKKWFKPMVEERKFKHPLKFFTRHPNKSLGDILSWGYLDDLKVYAIKREFGVQYFKFVKDIKTLPW
ncbi:hypothetical protein Hanom_Chr01g00042811 [Helianthus anomalus]